MHLFCGMIPEIGPVPAGWLHLNCEPRPEEYYRDIAEMMQRLLYNIIVLITPVFFRPTEYPILSRRFGRHGGVSARPHGRHL